MENEIILKLTNEDYKLLKGCVLTVHEALKSMPYKSKDIKNKIKEIDTLLAKLN